MVKGLEVEIYLPQGFLNIKWAKWKRVLLTRSVAMVPCVIIAATAVNSLDYLNEYINVEQSLLVMRTHSVEYSTCFSPLTILTQSCMNNC